MLVRKPRFGVCFLPGPKGQGAGLLAAVRIFEKFPLATGLPGLKLKKGGLVPNFCAPIVPTFSLNPLVVVGWPENHGRLSLKCAHCLIFYITFPRSTIQDGGEGGGDEGEAPYEHRVS
jgi:hypothetical protein